MPEWTGAKRAEMYQCLAEGRLDDARLSVARFLDLKQNDFKPIPKALFSQLKIRIAAEDDLQAQFCRMTIDENQSVRRLALLLLGMLGHMPGHHFAECVRRLTSAITKRDLSLPEAVNNLYALNMLNLTRAVQNQLYCLIEAICLCPSKEALAALRTPPKCITKGTTYSCVRTWMDNKKLAGKYEKVLAAFEKTEEEITQSHGGLNNQDVVQPVGLSEFKDERISTILQLLDAGDVEGIKALAKAHPLLKDAFWQQCFCLISSETLSLLSQNEEFLQQLFKWLESDARPLYSLASILLRSLAVPLRNRILQAIESLFKRKGIWWNYSERVPARLMRALRCLLDLAFVDPDPTSLWHLVQIAEQAEAKSALEKIVGAVLYEKHGLEEARSILNRLIDDCRQSGANMVIRLSIPDFLVGVQRIVETAYIESDPLRSVSLRYTSPFWRNSNLTRMLDDTIQGTVIFSNYSFKFEKIYLLDGCETLEDYERILRENDLLTTEFKEQMDRCLAPWSRLSCLLRYILVHRRSFDLIDRSVAPRYLPLLIEELRRLPDHLATRQLYGDLYDHIIPLLFHLYLLLAREPDPVIRDCFERLVVQDDLSYSVYILQGCVEKFCEMMDRMSPVRSWWGDYLIPAIKAARGQAEHGWATLWRMREQLGSGALERLLTELEHDPDGQPVPLRILEKLRTTKKYSYHMTGKVIYALSRGVAGYRLLMDDEGIQGYHVFFLRQFAGEEPALIPESFQFWKESITPDYYFEKGVMSYFLNDPACRVEAAAIVAQGLESSDSEVIDRSFRVAFQHADVLAKCGFDLLHLTSLGLWQSKLQELKKAILRLHALAEFGRCTPAAAAAAIEQAFTIEEPMLWRAAADALKALRKKDPALALQDPARVRELLARDPEKYGKYLNPLLKNAPEASRHA